MASRSAVLGSEGADSKTGRLVPGGYVRSEEIVLERAFICIYMCPHVSHKWPPPWLFPKRLSFGSQAVRSPGIVKKSAGTTEALLSCLFGSDLHTENVGPWRAFSAKNEKR